jgi:hypothetical protein
MKKKKSRKGLWLLLLLIAVLASGFYFRRQVTSTLGIYVSKVRAALSLNSGRHASEGSATKSQAASSSQSKFVFFPDGRSRFAWSVQYPDGRVFKLGEEFSSDCTPTVGRAKTPETARFEFSEQRSCNSALRQPVQVDAAALKDVNGDGSPELVATILTGGNIYGHTSSLISLTPKGPKLLRRLD